jgi:sec-independent protein translocase protein TatB
LRDELGPEFADVDLRNLNPRTAISRALLGDETELPRRVDARAAAQNLIMGSDEPEAAAPTAPTAPAAPAPHPLGRGEHAPFDADAT